MAKRIVILDKQGPGRWTVAFWMVPPAARQVFYAQPGAVSAWKDASGADTASIQTGATVERVETYSAEGSPGLAAVQSALQARWTALQAEIDADNPWVRYGSSWDGTSWTAGGVS